MSELTAMAQRMSDALGWGLIHFIWQGAALALALAFVRLLLPRNLAKARYAAGCVTLALMLAAPALTIWQLSDPREPASPFFEETPTAAVVTGSSGATIAPALIEAPADTGGDRRLVVDPAGWLPWLVLAWSVGVLICSARLAGGWWQARRLVREGTRPLSANWQQLKDTIAARLELTRAVTLLESTRLQVPVVIGILRPVLLVPTAVLAGLSPQQLEAVIAHELAHIRRHDYLTNLLQSAVETLLFYHPAVWWVSQTVRTEREHCCDDLAVLACGDAVLYARALTAIETLRNEGIGVAMAVNGSPLLARVRRLLGVKAPATVGSSAWVVALLTGLMVSGAGVTSWLRAVPIALADPADVATPLTQSAPTPPRRSPDLAEPAAANQAKSPDQSLDRAMASQERALEAASLAVEEAQRAHERENRSASTDARRMAREAMRQAHEMVRAAHLAAREASRVLRDARRSASNSWHFWSDDASAVIPEPPEPPEPPESPEPPEPPDAPEPPAPPLPPSSGLWATPPAPPAPPAPAAPPASPALPALAAPPAPPAPPAPAAPPAVPAPPAPPAVPAPPAPPAPPSPDAPSGWSSDDHQSSWNMTHSTNGVTLKISGRGRIDFSDDETDVKEMSSGAHFIVERRAGGVGGFFASEVKGFEARERGGSIERRFLDNGRELSADEGSKWLATFLPAMLRNMAINADRRVARQLAQGGPAMVLAEITKTEGTFAKSVYLRELYKQRVLDAQTLARSFQQAAREIESDFELGQALRVAADRQPIDQAIPAFVEATRTMQSDFELRQVLSKALGRPGLTPETAGSMLNAAVPGADQAGLDADFEMAQLLKRAAKGGHVTDGSVAAFLAAARHVQSPFERRGVVQALATAKLSDVHMAEIVKLAGAIDSDFERSQAIVGLSRSAPLGTATKKALADAAMSINSDFERGRALNALTRAGVLTAAQ